MDENRLSEDIMKLKAEAYDLLVTLEDGQRRLKEISARIQQLQMQEKK